MVSPVCASSFCQTAALVTLTHTLLSLPLSMLLSLSIPNHRIVITPPKDIYR